jgi:hypothetical protein
MRRHIPGRGVPFASHHSLLSNPRQQQFGPLLQKLCNFEQTDVFWLCTVLFIESCPLCASVSQAESSAEICIHFRGPKVHSVVGLRFLSVAFFLFL